MAQHIWITRGGSRICEDCLAVQFHAFNRWTPPVYPICPGDDDAGSRRGPRKPLPPEDAPSRRELVEA